VSDNTFLSNLLVNLGCRADRAQEVISTALEDGEAPAHLQDQIEPGTRLAVTVTPQGITITPGEQP
jgi:hypothetical protein